MSLNSNCCYGHHWISSTQMLKRNERMAGRIVELLTSEENNGKVFFFSAGVQHLLGTMHILHPQGIVYFTFPIIISTLTFLSVHFGSNHLQT